MPKMTEEELAQMAGVDKQLELDKYSGSLSPFYNWIHMQEIRESEVIQRALMYDTTDLFMHDLKWRVENQMNFIIVHFGQQGSGKSSNAQYIGSYITDFVLKLYETKWKDKKEEFLRTWKRMPIFDASNLCMTRTEYVERVQSSVQLETLVFDEDQPSYIGMGSKLEMETQERFEKCLRSTQINMQFCSPSMEEHIGNYYLEAYDKDTKRKINRSLVYIKTKDGILEPVSNIKLPYVYLPGYSEKKEKFNIHLKYIQESDNITIYERVAKWVLENYHVFEEDEKTGKLRQLMKNETIKSIIKRQFGERRFVESQLKAIISQIDYTTNEERYRKQKDEDHPITSGESAKTPEKSENEGEKDELEEDLNGK